MSSSNRPPLLPLPTAECSSGCYLASASASQVITSNRALFQAWMLNMHHPWSKPTVLLFVGQAICTTGMGVLAQRTTLLFPGLKSGTRFLSLNLISLLWGYLQIQQNNKIMSRLGTLSVFRSPGCVHSWCRARTELVLTPPSANTPLGVYQHAGLFGIATCHW